MKMKKSFLYAVFSLILILACPAAVYGQDTDEDLDKTLAPYFLVEGADSSADHFPLKDTKVTVNIDGVIADTYVTQTYTNEGSSPINARYNFPASTRASVHGMTMQIGDKKITAKIKEKEEAKEEFDEAKSEGKSASLLEQQRPNVFTMNVANVMPGDTVTIELHYTELIVPTEGIYQFVFPTVVGPRYMSPSEDPKAETNQWVETPYLEEGKTPTGKYDITVNLSTGVPITDISSKSHEITVNKRNASTASVTLSNPEDYAGNRDFVLNYKLTGQDISAGLMLDQEADENYFMMMVQPPEHYQPEVIPPREYIFVLDVSGSMWGYPLDTAKVLLKNLVSGLKETDTFNVITFSGGSSQLSPQSVPATADNVQKAMDFIGQEDGGGGTELASALQTALDIPKNDSTARSIITITDGYISGEKDIFDIVKSNLNKASFFSFGIGDSVNRYLVDGIAKAGQGESFVVTDAADAQETAKRFQTYIQAPLLTDVKVSYSGFDTYDVEPQTLPTMFAQRPLVLYGKWRGEPTGTIQITGKYGGRDYVKDIPVSQVTPQKGNPAISYLWARTKVENLTDYNSDAGADDTVKKEVTDLGLKYSMMTPYTSFIAVMEEIRNPTGDGKDVNQPLPLPEGVSDYAVGDGYTVGSEPGFMLLIPAALLLVLINGLFYAKKKRKRL